RLPCHGQEPSVASGSRLWASLPVRWLPGRFLPLVVACAQHAHLDLPWPCPEPGDPNTSLNRWVAATPAMTIIEPMATDCNTIAMRSLLQFFDIIWACGPRSLRL